jgi:arylsulfatase A-like enzyme
VRIALLLAAALALMSCERGSDPQHERWNVILVSIDSLRADHLGSYGYGRDTSPNIDALAAEGVLFERATAQAPWTLPSHASMLTSLYSRTHQADDPRKRLPGTQPTLASTLRESGHSTHAIVSGTFMWAHFGLAKGFDSYDDSIIQSSHQANHEAITSPEIHQRVRGLLDREEEPFFFFLHYWDVHYDFVPPPPYDTLFDPDYEGSIDSSQFIQNPAIRPEMDPRDLQHVIALYDGEVAWVDSWLGKLVNELKERGLYDRTVIVLTSDHGDEFFEHGEKGHQHSLYEELLHVPLIIRIPGLAEGKRIAERVELIDIMPTLLELTGAPAAPGMQGRSLLPLIRGEPWVARASFAETTKGRKNRLESEKSQIWAVYKGEQKLILFDADRYPAELFDLSKDGGEQRNLSAGEAEMRRALAGDLERWLQRTPTSPGAAAGELDDAMRRQLEALGYLDP